MMLWRRLRQLYALFDVVVWPCAYCATSNETPRIIWRQVRTNLLCDACGSLQNYQGYIAHFDPVPFGQARDDRRDRPRSATRPDAA